MSEQEHADQVARAIDRLMAGQAIPAGDPLLDLAATLAHAPVLPRPQAFARFEQQLDQWFGAPAPTVPAARPLPAPILVAGIALVVIVVIVLALLVIGPLIAPPPTSAPTATTPPTATSTTTPTVTLTATPETAVPTLSGTPPAFSRVIVSGQIGSIQGNTIVVLGQPIRIEGALGRLCVGDLVRAEVSISADGVYSASRADVSVETSACPPAPTAPPQPNPGGGQPDGRHDDD